MGDLGNITEIERDNKEQAQESVVVGVIDLGSNSLRLQVSEVRSGVYKIIHDYRHIARLGDNVYKTGNFDKDDEQALMTTLETMQSILKQYGAERYRAVGTAPFRDAENSARLINKVKEKLDLNIEVITGEEEARLTYLAATRYFDLNDASVLFVDIGGGSCEFAHSLNGELVKSVSSPLGCLRLTKMFIKGDKADADELDKLTKYISTEVDAVLSIPNVDKIIFTGGTVNNLAQVYAKRSNMSDAPVKFVDKTFFHHLVKELASKNYADRAKIPDLEADRADIALAAALVVDKLVKQYDLVGFFTFSGGLRSGVTIDLLNSMGVELFFQSTDISDISYLHLVETGRKYNFEEKHALHVTNLTKQLFEQLYKELKLEKSDWRLLEVASILHDIGQHISYSDHHKHSAYLIKNTGLVGYSTKEIDIISCIARYHRRGLPKNDHHIYSELSPKNKELVQALSSILRMADGLDRSHTSSVESIDMMVQGKTITMVLESKNSAVAEIDGFNKKKDLFVSLVNKNFDIITKVRV